MTQSMSVPAESQDVVRLHAKALRQNQCAKRVFTAAVFAIVIGNGWYGYHTTRTTVEHRSDELGKALLSEAESIAPELTKVGGASLAGLSARYSQALSTTFERDRDKYVQALMREMDELRHHATTVQPRLHEALEKMAVRLEGDLKRDLAKRGIPEDKIAAVGESYVNALEHSVTGVIEGPLTQYQTHVDSITDKLEKLAEKEPPLPSESPTFLLGMALEWAGRDMQKGVIEPAPEPVTAAVSPSRKTRKSAKR